MTKEIAQSFVIRLINWLVNIFIYRHIRRIITRLRISLLIILFMEISVAGIQTTNETKEAVKIDLSEEKWCSFYEIVVRH